MPYLVKNGKGLAARAKVSDIRKLLTGKKDTDAVLVPH